MEIMKKYSDELCVVSAALCWLAGSLGEATSYSASQDPSKSVSNSPRGIINPDWILERITSSYLQIVLT